MKAGNRHEFKEIGARLCMARHRVWGFKPAIVVLYASVAYRRANPRKVGRKEGSSGRKGMGWQRKDGEKRNYLKRVCFC